MKYKTIVAFKNKIKAVLRKPITIQIYYYVKVVLKFLTCDGHANEVVPLPSGRRLLRMAQLARRAMSPVP